MSISTAIFGGSFAPVHEGHLAVAQGVLQNGLAGEVWMLPCRRNPLKEDSPEYSDEERVRMIETAVKRLESEGRVDKDTIKVCDIEFTMPSPSYTSDTLRTLQALYPDREFRLVVGADSYLNFTKWRDWEWLEANFSPIIYPRPGYELTEVRERWTVLKDVRQVDISSTEIRNKNK